MQVSLADRSQGKIPVGSNESHVGEKDRPVLAGVSDWDFGVFKHAVDVIPDSYGLGQRMPGCTLHIVMSEESPVGDSELSVIAAFNQGDRRGSHILPPVGEGPTIRGPRKPGLQGSQQPELRGCCEPAFSPQASNP